MNLIFFLNTNFQLYNLSHFGLVLSQFNLINFELQWNC